MTNEDLEKYLIQTREDLIKSQDKIEEQFEKIGSSIEGDWLWRKD